MNAPLHVWRYELRFVCPAFVGDADHNGAWRTPPIKAQLRQWWRAAYAADCAHRVDVDAMRRAEAALFGAASDNGRSSKSLVRLRLDRWDAGKLKKGNWQPLQRVPHPEVDRVPTADLYLGYGPVTLDNGQRKASAAIQDGESATLAVALAPRVSADDCRRLQHALHLMHRYGTLGGRSRNGWGSYTLEPLEGTPAWPAEVDAGLRRPWRDALALDWPHALGSDERGALAWSTGPQKDWRAVMVELARLKIALRTSFRFTTGKDTQHPEQRHWLAYPVTNHSVLPWRDARLPNQLRFKLRPFGSGPQVEGFVFHVAHRPPAVFRPNTPTLERVWLEVHAFLDRQVALRPAEGRRAAVVR